MSIQIFNLTEDKVISSFVGLGQSSYRFALEQLAPLINRFEAQRKFLDTKFYERLERDILKGCLMPPITISFVEPGIKISTREDFEVYVNKNISHGYVLDGIQRLNTLMRAAGKDGFNPDKEIFLNVIVADNKDKLLYRMITLNNGQKGMTPRHQIEILTKELFDFKELKISVQTEKQKSEEPIKEAYSLGDISKGYISFLTSNVHNENSKIIEEKMDEILVNRILDIDLESYHLQFTDVILFLNKVSSNDTVRSWLQVSNNFIGFCVGIKKSFEYVFAQPVELLQNAFQNFDAAFKVINPSKVNVGKFRRELSAHFIENAIELFEKNTDFLSDRFFQITITE